MYLLPLSKCVQMHYASDSCVIHICAISPVQYTMDELENQTFLIKKISFLMIWSNTTKEEKKKAPEWGLE